MRQPRKLAEARPRCRERASQIELQSGWRGLEILGGDGGGGVGEMWRFMAAGLDRYGEPQPT